MKTLYISIKITILMALLLSVVYVITLWGFAEIAAPNGGNPEVVTLHGKIVGASNIGQNFTEDIYFWGRPSCAGDGYNATASAGSNKGPTNEEYLDEVKQRINIFLAKHPYLHRSEVTAEMVTASGSGLDPDITPESAKIQIKRVADARGVSTSTIKAIVDESIEKPLLGFIGTTKINVLKLNKKLDERLLK